MPRRKDTRPRRVYHSSARQRVANKRAKYLPRKVYNNIAFLGRYNNHVTATRAVSPHRTRPIPPARHHRAPRVAAGAPVRTVSGAKGAVTVQRIAKAGMGAPCASTRRRAWAAATAAAGGGAQTQPHTRPQSSIAQSRSIITGVGGSTSIVSRGAVRNASTARWSGEPIVVMPSIVQRVHRRIAFVSSYVPCRRRSCESLS
jgi:hypothetical protein